MGNFAWTTDELKILKEWYPKEGAPGCRVRIPKRSYNSIVTKASLYGLKSPYCSANKGRK
jgi:hypothetical protein